MQPQSIDGKSSPLGDGHTSRKELNDGQQRIHKNGGPSNNSLPS